MSQPEQSTQEQDTVHLSRDHLLIAAKAIVVRSGAISSDARNRLVDRIEDTLSSDKSTADEKADANRALDLLFAVAMINIKAAKMSRPNH